MKKVILSKPQPEKVVCIDSVSLEKYYGLENKYSSKAFVTASSFEGKPLVVCANRLTIGNGWSVFDNKKTLPQCLNTAIKEEFTVYEFDTYQELFEWLAK